MKLWIDDVRPAPEGWTWVKTVDEVNELILDKFINYFCDKTEENVELSIDHDAGTEMANGGDYIKILDKLDYYVKVSSYWKEYIMKYFTFHIHSQNPVGVENMRRIIKRNGWKEI